MKNTTSSRMTRIFRFSLMPPFRRGATTSSVSVEEEVSTSDDRVDIEAASTSTMTMAMMTGERVLSIVGIMASKPLAATSSCVINSRPKPPRK